MLFTGRLLVDRNGPCLILTGSAEQQNQRPYSRSKIYSSKPKDITRITTTPTWIGNLSASKPRNCHLHLRHFRIGGGSCGSSSVQTSPGARRACNPCLLLLLWKILKPKSKKIDMIVIAQNTDMMEGAVRDCRLDLASMKMKMMPMVYRIKARLKLLANWTTQVSSTGCLNRAIQWALNLNLSVPFEMIFTLIRNSYPLSLPRTKRRVFFSFLPSPS